MNDFIRRICGDNPGDASKRGAYLARMNAKGVPGVWECRPSCALHGDQDDATIAAVLGEPAQDGRGEGRGA